MLAPISSNAGRQSDSNSATTLDPSTSAGNATSSREEQSSKEQTQTKRDRSKPRESQPSKRLANILPAPSMATANGTSRGPQSSSVGQPITEGQHSTEHRCNINTYLNRTDSKNIFSLRDALKRHCRLVHLESQESQKAQEAYEKMKRN
ncbi:hypothetical protein sscle_09g073830 [Sclerotinia sclerotiorum 1980 UF-70]|uniref:Uncharacterized protein n=1 Tax=Sclerotinia sclerotiorum (strain ATCC 18683 / 1980 / Ss-1) TaxID=665079 RepID=A0A1D9QDB9_SCLS1|nr:hypothetical protein sscle_09g073830 [Sclerotinia sclerotiorum 1980 UF-70]